MCSLIWDVTDPEFTDPDLTDPEFTDPEFTDPDLTDPDTIDPNVTDPDGDLIWETLSEISNIPSRLYLFDSLSLGQIERSCFV